MLQTFNEKNRDLIININGSLVHRDKAGVSPFDSVVQGGDAVWDGLRLYDRRIFKLTQHLDRLESSARALAFAHIPTHEDIRREIARTLEANHMTDGVHIRLTLTRGVSLITSSLRRFPPDCLDPKIHSNNLIQSILAKIQANAAGADDALMLDTHGFVAETNATHVFIVDASGGTVLTSTTRACPEGITRATVIELCKANGIVCREVADLSLTDVYRAREMFCTGTMGELAPVVRVDGRTIGGESSMIPGPMTQRLMALYGNLTSTAGEQIVD